MTINRVFLFVLDSFGCGEQPDSAKFNDEGSNTLGSVSSSQFFSMPESRNIGLLNIEGIRCAIAGVDTPSGSFSRLLELSSGKDTTIGHWEIAGIVSEKALPTFPGGFPAEFLDELSRQTGRGWLCNKPYSGTDVITDYGDEQVKTGKLIVYTSADSVFQIAAHEGIVPLSELYSCCEKARALLLGELGVGRVIARPFTGESGAYTRTRNRHDFSLPPPGDTMLDHIKAAGKESIAVGKIGDIFAMRGVTKSLPTKSNREGMERAISLAGESFNGLAFINLVDFDMVYGHRNDIDGYARALSEFDCQLGSFIGRLREDDVLLITADHGCDPATVGTDHSREYVPLLIFGKGIKPGVDLGTRRGFSDIGKTVLELLGVEGEISGTSFAGEILKG